MYKLYWHPWSSSYAPMAVLEELKVEFDLYEVDYDGGETHTAKYRRLQPLGLIPALQLDNGVSMFESAAIILYLCDRHREVQLAPNLNDVDRPHYLQWLFFLADTLYPSYNRFYHPERYTTSKEGIDGVKTKASQIMMTQWQVVEDSLRDNGPWLLGDRFSACDIYLQMISTWHADPCELLAEFPNVKNVAAGVVVRQGCQRAFKRHNFHSGLS